VNLLRIELVGILLIGLTAFGLCAETGTLTGTVTEEKTKMDLSGVSVEIMDSHLGAATDDRGHFYITGIEPGVYQLQFSAIGYTTLARDSILINPGHTTSLSIQLEAQVLKLDEITVTATRQAQLKIFAPSVQPMWTTLSNTCREFQALQVLVAVNPSSVPCQSMACLLHTG